VPPLTAIDGAVMREIPPFSSAAGFRKLLRSIADEKMDDEPRHLNSNRTSPSPTMQLFAPPELLLLDTSYQSSL